VQLVSETFLNLRIIEGVMIKKMCIGLNVNIYYYFPILMTLEFLWQFFEKFSNIKFYENPFIGSRVDL
jgi:hypothetical protein